MKHDIPTLTALLETAELILPDAAKEGGTNG